VLTEFGWPASNPGTNIVPQNNVITGQNCGAANDKNQKAMIQGVIDLYRAKKLPCNTFEAFREVWKASSSGISFDAFWGVCSGNSPYSCLNVPS
jgi:exo-beta-1,3-glucanase (GH17 family)